MDLPVPKGAGRDQKGFHHPIQQLPTAPGKRRKRGIAVHSSCNDIPEGTGDHHGEACRKRRKSGGELGIFDSPMHPGVTRRPPERGEPVEAQGFRLVTLRSGLEPTSESLSGESIHIGEIGDVPGGLAGSDKGLTIPDAVPPFPASFPGRREQRDILYREQADPERKGKRRQDAASSPRVEDMHSRGCGGVVTDIDREARIPRAGPGSIHLRLPIMQDGCRLPGEGRAAPPGILQGEGIELASASASFSSDGIGGAGMRCRGRRNNPDLH